MATSPSTHTPATATPQEQEAAEAKAKALAEANAPLYPVDVILRPAFIDARDDLTHVLGLDQAQREAREQQYLAMVKRTGLDEYSVGGPLYKAVVEEEVRIVRQVESPDREREKAQGEEAIRRELSGKYHDADRMLKWGPAYVQADPDLREIFNQYPWLAWRPDIVIPLLEDGRRRGFPELGASKGAKP